METTVKLQDKKIKRYRLSSDKKNIIVDYADNTTDILPYDRKLEIEILEKYKGQINSKKKAYAKYREKVTKNKQLIIALGIIGFVLAALAPGAGTIAVEVILAAIAVSSGVKIAKNSVKMNELKKQIALADNVERLNGKKEKDMTPMDRELGKQPELFNLSQHEDYTNQEARDMILDVNGDDYYLRPLKTKVYQKVKTKFKRK